MWKMQVKERGKKRWLNTNYRNMLKKEIVSAVKEQRSERTGLTYRAKKQKRYEYDYY